MAMEKYIIPVVNCDEDWLLLTGQRETLTRQQKEEQGHRLRYDQEPIIPNFAYLHFANKLECLLHMETMN